jgi:guanylate kinase
MESIVVVFSGPSGCGKSTLIEHLCAIRPSLCPIITATTRPPRGLEKNDVDYQFLSKAEFETMQAKSGLLEFAQVHGHLYGTPKHSVERVIANGFHAVLNVDVQGLLTSFSRLHSFKGAMSVRKIYPHALLVFILPPSWDILKLRLSRRGTDDATTIDRRLASADAEISSAHNFDVILSNDCLSAAVATAAAIVDAKIAKCCGKHVLATFQASMPLKRAMAIATSASCHDATPALAAHSDLETQTQQDHVKIHPNSKL